MSCYRSMPRYGIVLFCTALAAGAGCDQGETGTAAVGPGSRAVSPPDLVQPRVVDQSPRELRPDDWFEDVTGTSGVRFSYRNGREGGQYSVLETVGGGVALLDYDGDGDLDLFFPGGGSISSGRPVTITGRQPALFRNDGDWRFVNVTAEAGLDRPGDYSLGCAVGDFNRDGAPDLLITCYGQSRLWQNNQNGGFVDVTERAGLEFDALSSAAAWADVDRDGWPDLYMVGYVRYDPDSDEKLLKALKRDRKIAGPWQFPGEPDRLFRNRGDGTFTEITDKAGLAGDGKGLGVLAADVNNDGWIDFYVANDTTRNHLYLVGPDLAFQEVGLTSGTAFDEFGSPEGSMGIDFGDYDGDGRGDLFVTNYEMEDNSLLRNLGQAAFNHHTLKSGLGNTCRPFVGFGTGFADFDTDGWLDLFVINGHVEYHSQKTTYRQPCFLYRNDGGERFEDVSDQGGPYFSVPHAGRGAAVGDLDNDGAPDLVVVHQNAPATLLRNRKTPDNWFRVKLIGSASDPLAVGAVASCPYQGRRLVRSVRGGTGYLSHFDGRILFPADGTPPEVEVRWPSGRVELFRDVSLRRTNRLEEGQGDDVGK